MLQADLENADTGRVVGTRNLGRLPDLLPAICVRLDNFILVSPYIVLSVLDG